MPQCKVFCLILQRKLKSNTGSHLVHTDNLKTERYYLLTHSHTMTPLDTPWKQAF